MGLSAELGLHTTVPAASWGARGLGLAAVDLLHAAPPADSPRLPAMRDPMTTITMGNSSARSALRFSKRPPTARAHHKVVPSCLRAASAPLGGACPAGCAHCSRPSRSRSLGPKRHKGTAPAERTEPICPIDATAGFTERDGQGPIVGTMDHCFAEAGSRQTPHPDCAASTCPGPPV